MPQPEEKSLDIIIPIYNEEECVDELISRLQKVRNNFKPAVDVSVIFANDGSFDGTTEKLGLYSGEEGFSWIKVVHLSRNFGHQMALTAGLDYSSADFVAIMDSDLQDPPELIIHMVERLKAGNDIVYGRRKQRAGETLFKRLTAKLFYFLIRLLCRVNIPENTGDFRVMNKKVVQAVQSLGENHRFMRGLVPWVGFKSEAFDYDREERYAGETKYPFRKMLSFALDAIFSFSSFPLKVATYIGIVLLFLGSAGALYILYLNLFTDKVVPGLTTLLISIITLSGVQILILGVIGEYVGRIFEEAKKRPLYITTKTHNLEGTENTRFRDSEKRRKIP